MAELLLFVCFLVGLLLVAVGAWMVSPAAGVVVAGLLLLGVALVYTRGAPRGGGQS